MRVHNGKKERDDEREKTSRIAPGTIFSDTPTTHPCVCVCFFVISTHFSLGQTNGTRYKANSFYPTTVNYSVTIVLRTEYA